MKVFISNFRRSKPRTVRVEISKHDTYSLDSTLAEVIAPALRAYKKHSRGVIWGCCLPENDHDLRGVARKRASAKAQREMGAILDKMIRAFELRRPPSMNIFSLSVERRESR